MRNLYKSCSLCPRSCKVDRTQGQTGFCGQTDQMVLSTAALHFGEEPPITGEGGSGTIFFSGCTMGCPFCQNWQISRGFSGAVVSTEKLVEIMLKLQNRGAENINLVTGTHFLPSIKEAVEQAKIKGLMIPLVWNCSGYESEEAIGILNSFIDIYLPDYKTSDPVLAERLYKAKDYPLVAERAIVKMVMSKPMTINDQGVMERGVIIRHLVLPGELESSRKFFKWYSQTLNDKAIISVMVQYAPVQIPGNTVKIPDRYITQEECDRLLIYMDEYGIEEGFFQDLDTGNDWLPDFNKSEPFPSKQTRVIWSSLTSIQ